VNVIVDTSVWSLALRRRTRDLNGAKAAIVSDLRNLIDEGRARIIGLVRQEMLSGIKARGQYEKLRELLRAFPNEIISTEDYEFAAKAGNQCRARGVAVSVSDMLICAVAISREWSIFTTDPDFSAYAKILPLKSHSLRKK
jgi:predicted nucleic acid-binding protein